MNRSSRYGLINGSAAQQQLEELWAQRCGRHCFQISVIPTPSPKLTSVAVLTRNIWKRGLGRLHKLVRCSSTKATKSKWTSTSAVAFTNITRLENRGLSRWRSFWLSLRLILKIRDGNLSETSTWPYQAPWTSISLTNMLNQLIRFKGWLIFRFRMRWRILIKSLIRRWRFHISWA